MLLRRVYILLAFLVFTSTALAQEADTTEKVRRNRYGIWFLPSAAPKIYGIAIGPFGSELFCDLEYTRYSYGVNIQLLGQGFFGLFYALNPSRAFHNHNLGDENKTNEEPLGVKRAVHNGILITGLGTFSDEINGISISPWASVNHKVNGISLNALINSVFQLNGISLGLYNSSHTTNGVQLGIINKTKKLKGIQIGLWNVNEKRRLPLINWGGK
jgi:hypothetical protein